MAARRRLSIRRARLEDLPACGRIWRDALNDYLARLNQPLVPDELDGLRQLHQHTLRTDPGRFLVAVRHPASKPSGAAGAEPSGAARDERFAAGAEPSGAAGAQGDTQPGRGRPRVVAFASAVERGPLCYLSMLFVDPAEQGHGLGARLLDRALPRPSERAGHFVAIATDSAQPISNALYASRGVPPRTTLHHLLGRPDRPAALPPLPDGLTRQPIAATPAALPRDIDLLDREVQGYERRADHAWFLEVGRLPFSWRHEDGSLAGYGYASPAGNVGPVVARDAADLPALVADLLRAVPARGAHAVWVPGPAGSVTSMLIRAGFRIEDFPLLLLWDRPLVDLDRYLPMSPGLP